MPGALITTKEPAELNLTRALGPFEHLIWLVDQRTPLRVVLVVRIEGSSVSAKDLSSALLAQRRHPMLRTAIQANENGEPNFVPSSAPIPLRVIQRTDQLQWLREAEALSSIPFEPGDSPLLRAALVQGEAVSELILVAHHSIGDGVSAMYLVRDLLESMEGYKLEPLPPRPSLEESVFGIEQAQDGERQFYRSVLVQPRRSNAYKGLSCRRWKLARGSWDTSWLAVAPRIRLCKGLYLRLSYCPCPRAGIFNAFCRSTSGDSTHSVLTISACTSHLVWRALTKSLQVISGHWRVPRAGRCCKHWIRRCSERKLLRWQVRLLEGRVRICV
jgi:hypothetical protein